MIMGRVMRSSVLLTVVISMKRTQVISLLLSQYEPLLYLVSSLFILVHPHPKHVSPEKFSLSSKYKTDKNY